MLLDWTRMLMIFAALKRGKKGARHNKLRNFFGVGKVTEARLKEFGIQRGADLKQVSEEQLRAPCSKNGGACSTTMCMDMSRWWVFCIIFLKK